MKLVLWLGGGSLVVITLLLAYAMCKVAQLADYAEFDPHDATGENIEYAGEVEES